MAHRDVIVVGASAGGVEALRAMVGGLPADLPASVLIVLHVPRETPSALTRILDRAGPLPVRTAFDGEPLVPGRIYVAPPDRHMLVLGDRVRINSGPSENGHRPAIDPLFRSAARAAGTRVIAVVLSGNRDDGAVGAEAVAVAGGVVVVQEPGDALNDSMPRAVLNRLDPDHLVGAADLGALLVRLTAVTVPDQPAVLDHPLLDIDKIIDPPAVYGCPSCGGGLFELEIWPQPAYRCRIGHAWSPESLLEEQATTTEGALWTALRALEEKTALSRRLADRERAGSGGRFARMADDAEAGAGLIRDLLARIGGSTTEPEV
ncbi:two-component system chemotaxis response regulator CheB [Actinoplanes tereljensis]|uniref:protein-glutamate methylesterase n=1 Tax=Paractinoplanes tereljensis TaxID=571912 RepID=A0A919NQ88_9ACTN|nr:chemotaxis protein CheB [Actinoplanes tereljensis]GIF21657.1 chemotaxis protein CheB [Actinoplanes tereljensis]